MPRMIPSAFAEVTTVQGCVWKNEMQTKKSQLSATTAKAVIPQPAGDVPNALRYSRGIPGRNTNIPPHTLQKPQAVIFQNAPPLPSMEDFPEIMYTTGARDSCILAPTNKLKSSSHTINQRHISETTTPQKKRIASGDWKQVGNKPPSRQLQRPPVTPDQVMLQTPASQPLSRQQTQSAQQ